MFCLFVGLCSVPWGSFMVNFSNSDSEHLLAFLHVFCEVESGDNDILSLKSHLKGEMRCEEKGLVARIASP